MITLPDPKARREATRRLMELSNTPIMACLQCGKCTAGCPFAEDMDLSPHQIVRFAQLGLVANIARCEAIWYCASCFTCQSRCPVGIDIAALAEAVRMLSLMEDGEKYGPDSVSPDAAADAPQQALVSLYRKFSN